MTLEELRRVCAESAPEEWHPIEGITAPEGDHYARATYRPDIRLAIAWGRERASGAEFAEPWATSFPDATATARHVDFLYAGSLVDREMYVAVDGGRCLLPLPKMEGTLPTYEDRGFSITPWQRDFFRLLNALGSSANYDDYLHRAHLYVLDE
jgi:hypothetical protein